MSDDQGHDHKKRRMAVIGISSVMLVAMVVAVTVGVRGTHHNVEAEGSNGSSDGNDISSSTKAIQSICQPTDYRQTCERTLAHSNSSDPKELIQTAFHSAVETIEGALQNSSTIKAAEHDPRTAGALEVCKEVMNYAVGDLNRSIDQIGEFELSKLDDYIENMRVWLSGAITFQETCIDAFENTTGDAGDKMKKFLNASQELTTNALAMTSELSGIVKSLDIPGLGDVGRFLSEKTVKGEKFPHWVDVRQRNLLATPGAAVKADVVVAKDGSGKFKTITEALKQVPSDPKKTFVIYIKEGIYEEQVRVEATMTNVMFIGDGPTKTKITGNKNFAHGIVVYQTPTVSVIGNNFIAKDIGFENSAGPEGHQAVALLVQSDMSIFYNCQIDGYESTLCALSHRQFYRECTITGTKDIIFGDAAAVFQNCHVVIRKPLDDQECSVTAQGRTNPKETTGFVLQNCTVVADPLFYPVRAQNKAYLGRTAKKFSRTIVMQSSIDDSIDPEGWAPWMGSFGTDTCYYAEYENRGPGAATQGRVKWAGIKKISAQEVLEFTPGKFLGGDQWIVPTQVPYVSGMIKI